MILDQKELKLLYPSTAEYSHIFYDKASNLKEFRENFVSSKLWRLNNLYTIIDKVGKTVPFIMNTAQHLVYSTSLTHPRLIILKSRQQGISTLWLISFFDDALFNKNFSVGLMAQGLDESSKLLERIGILWQYIPIDVLKMLDVDKAKDNSKEFSFNNGSSIYVRTSFRSATLQRLHISEFGKISNANPKRARETKAGTLQTITAGNTVIIESTAEGANAFKEMWDTAVDFNETGQLLAPKDFKPVFLSWMDDPDCSLSIPQAPSKTQEKYFVDLEDITKVVLTPEQTNFWVAQYRELNDEIYQEYPATPDEAFAATRDGSFYNKLYRMWVIKKGRELNNLYDPNLDVFCTVDLGMNDSMVLIFWQVHRNEVRIINEYVNNGEAIEHYVDVMKSMPFNIKRVDLPHDANVVSLNTGKTRLSRFIELGCNARVIRKVGLQDGIALVRKLVPHLWIDKRCTYVRSCFLNYSKEWDDKLGNWKNKPQHDEWSHGADDVRYIAQEVPSSVLSSTWGLSDKKESSPVVDGMCL